MKLTIELKGIKETIEGVKEHKFRVMRIAAMALNKAAQHGKAVIAKEVRKEFTMKARDIKEEMTVEKANMRWLKAKIVISGRTIPLISFQSKGTGGRRGAGIKAVSRTKKSAGKINPVHVMVKKSSGYKILPKAFKARGRYGEDIFVRTSRARAPIKALRGPSMSGMVKDVDIYARVVTAIKRKAINEFERGLQHAMDKGRIAIDE